MIKQIGFVANWLTEESRFFVRYSISKSGPQTTLRLMLLEHGKTVDIYIIKSVLICLFKSVLICLSKFADTHITSQSREMHANLNLPVEKETETAGHPAHDWYARYMFTP